MDQKELFIIAKSKLTSKKYPHDAAIHQIIYNIPIAHSTETVAEVRQRIIDNIKNYSTINYIYVVTTSHKLKGVFSFRDLFTIAEDTKIKDILNSNVYFSHPHTDKERVAHLALKHNIKAIPIVDDKKTLLGVVPSNKVLQILQDEQQEDLLHLSGIVPSAHQHFSTNSVTSGSVFTATLHRSPWIIIGIFGGLLTAKVIGGFESILEDHIVLASFIPLVAYVANAVGTQTQTLYIRDIALGNINIGPYALKQLSVTAMIGVISWILLVLLGTLFWNSTLLGNVVGISVIVAILAATFFALFIPLSLEKIGIDPAIGSGPFATIIQDLLSVILFLTIAQYLL